MNPVLDVRDLRYELAAQGSALVDGVSFSVGAGETLVLLGRSGAGKTTTLKLVNRLLVPTDGAVVVAGQRADAVEATQLRRRMGYVIQEVGLFPHFSVAANVGLLPRLERWSRGRIERRGGGGVPPGGIAPDNFFGRLPPPPSAGPPPPARPDPAPAPPPP